jgi:hydrogenase-4 component B
MEISAAIWFFIGSIILAVGGGLATPMAYRWPKLQQITGAGSVTVASCAGLIAAVKVLVSGVTESLRIPWDLPFGTFIISIDPLSAFFMVPLFTLGLLGALYAIPYLRGQLSSPAYGMHWFYYNALVASMAVVLAAADSLLFLLAWEIMSLTSFMLVLHKHEEKESQEAAWIYFIAAHIGTAFLLVFFILAGVNSGAFTFSSFAVKGFSPLVSTILFIAALIGFGIKAGFIPFHVWLPRAHPAAPSHVSALMSGVMIKIGVYGIARALTFITPFQSWWGIALIIIGSVSGIFGVLLALGQHDLKRLLAYHSVENIGIITLGLGAGILGVTEGIPLLAILGFCGGLLHVINHAFFKGLLFLGAGSVLHATGTLEIDRLGGLIKKMPSTAFCFLIGSAAICGLPPLNGFVSEFLIYLGSFSGLRSPSIVIVGSAALLMASLALIGGLAVACFTKAFGVVFLGEPRMPLNVTHDADLLMRIPLYALSALCLAIGLFFWLFAPLCVAPVSILSGMPVEQIAGTLSGFFPALTAISSGCFVFITMIVVLYLYRKHVLRNGVVAAAPTWDCGYIAPNSRMQYTASSFAQPIVSFFKHLLLPHTSVTVSESVFPRNWKFNSHVPDGILERIYVPLVSTIGAVLSKLRWLQGGRVHTYVMYIALTLIALLLWNFVWKPR